MRYGHYFVLLFAAVLILSSSGRVYALERGVVLDSRLGAVHVGGNYPDRHTQGDFLVWGGVKAYKLGFDSTEIFIPSNLCFGVNNPIALQPYGPYQARDKYCEAAPGKWPKAKSLTEFVRHPDVLELFSLPLKRFYLTAYPLNPNFRINERKEITGTPYTQAELDSLRTEYYDFTKYLLTTYRTSAKTFAVMPMVTMDRWLSGRDFEEDDSPGECTVTDTAPQNRIDNMIAYFSTISSAMRQAKQDAGASQTKVYLTCEVNSVICPMELPAVKAAINSVIPNVGCDLVGYAGYELRTISYNRNDPNLIDRTLDYMATKTPNHPDFGNKNIVISEIGLQEQRATDSMFTWFTETFIPEVLSWGVPHIQLWALGSCRTYNPGPAEQSNPNDCPGMWMFRPDGTPSKLYRYLRDHYGSTLNQPSPTPTTPPTKNPADLIDTGDSPGDQVNQHDADKLKSDFGKTGTPGWIASDINDDGNVDVFDYNMLVGAFGD